MRRSIWLPAFLASAATATFTQAQQAPATVKDAIQAVENEWATAYLKHDASILERILDKDYYIYDAATGVTGTKATEIESTKKSKAAFTSVANPLHSVRVHGDFAIVIGRYVAKGTENGKPIADDSPWQTIFAKRDGKWVALASFVAPGPPAKKP
jgi:ketosteroid isomerase-like protein